MNDYTIDREIKVMYVTAGSFPDGVLEAHQQLHSKIPFSQERKYFGISFPEDGVIIYKAAAEEMYTGEAAEKGFETYTIRTGKYACMVVSNYMNNTAAIGEAFQNLLKHPQLDPEGYCLEWYISQQDVQCMVPLKNINQ